MRSESIASLPQNALISCYVAGLHGLQTSDIVSHTFLCSHNSGRFRGTCKSCFPDRDTLVLPGGVELPPGLEVPGLAEPSSILVCTCRKKDGSTIIGTTLDLSMYQFRATTLPFPQEHVLHYDMKIVWHGNGLVSS